jgi:hypothetical protein
MKTDPTRTRPRPPLKPPAPSLPWIALECLSTIVIVAFLRPLVRRLGWDPRMGTRGRVIFTALDAALRMAMDGIVRAGETRLREREDIKARLRQQLGRPPWPEEIARAWRELRGLPADFPVPW